MPEDRQKLTSKSLEEFVSKVQSDPELKNKILKRLANSEDVMSVVNEFFALDDRQNQNLNMVKSKEVKETLGTGVKNALKTGGKIILLPPDPTLQNAGVHVGVHTGRNGTDIDVSITCPV